MKYQPKYKYKHYVRKRDGANVVIAFSTYAKKPVKGVAVCHPNDEFDMEKGKQLAAAACNEKVARLRLRRAKAELSMVIEYFDNAKDWLIETNQYVADAEENLHRAQTELNALRAIM